LTTSNTWLPVTGYPPTFLYIEPEPQDESPIYEGMSFNHVPVQPSG
jgi:hypothetical protein